MQISGKAVATAYVKARNTIGSTVIKDGKANYGKYATLAAVLEVITPALSANSLALIQEPLLTDDGVTVHASLLHESGETIEFAPITMPVAQRTAQSIGSAITYARRYQLTALLGIAADDDDGNAATGTASNATMPAKASTKPVEPRKPVEPTVVPNAPQNAPVRENQDAVDHLNKIGTARYGDEWITSRRAAAAEWASGKRTRSIDELSDEEISGIILKLS